MSNANFHIYAWNPIRRACQWVRFGRISAVIVAYAGDHVVSEIKFTGRGGKIVGYWAYGYFDPALPYRG